MNARDIEIGTEIKVTGDTYSLRKKLKSAGLTWDGEGWVGELTSTLRHQLGGWSGIEISAQTEIEQPSDEQIYKDWSDNPNSKY